MPLGSVVVYRRSSTTHCPQVVRLCTKGVPLPNALSQSIAQCPKAVRRCTTGVPLPTASASEVVHRRSTTTALAQCHAQVYHRTSTAHYPEAVR